MTLKDHKKCFVISPIGAENSETRKHADTVFHCIIEPACEPDKNDGGVRYVAERGDHKTAPGKITDQIYEDILNADLIISVLTESNPNVYYELAIAQAAAKPVILLLEKGFEAPFDIKDHRIIYYDFDPQAIFRGTYVDLLRAAMNAVDQKRGRHVVPFAPDLAPLGSPMHSLNAKASDAEEETLGIINRANRFFWLCGVSLKGWTMNQDFESALTLASDRFKSQSDESSPFQIMIMSPDNPSLEPSMKSAEIFESASQSVGVAKKAWAKLLDKLSCETAFAINNRKALNYQIAMSEHEAIAIPYLTSRDTLRSPYIYAKKQSFYYDAISEEFQFLWRESQIQKAEKPPARKASSKAPSRKR